MSNFNWRYFKYICEKSWGHLTKIKDINTLPLNCWISYSNTINQLLYQLLFSGWALDPGCRDLLPFGQKSICEVKNSCWRMGNHHISQRCMMELRSGHPHQTVAGKPFLYGTLTCWDKGRTNTSLQQSSNCVIIWERYAHFWPARTNSGTFPGTFGTICFGWS